MKKYVITLSITLLICLVGCSAPVDSEVTTATETMRTTEAASTSRAVVESTTVQPQHGFDPGQLAHDFELNDLDGNSIKLSDYAGKTVVLNFFASWCGPCQAETPHLNEAYLDLQDQDVVVLAVNLTFSRAGERTAVEDFIEDYDVAFPVALDLDGIVARKFRVRSIPTNIFIRPDGVIDQNIPGALNKDKFIEFIELAKAGE